MAKACKRKLRQKSILCIIFIQKNRSGYTALATDTISGNTKDFDSLGAKKLVT